MDINEKNKEKVATTSQLVLNSIMTRTSIRNYMEKPVENEKIELMLRAAMSAPSAGNKQPWRFVVVKDKNTLQKISAHFKTMGMVQKAPMAIILCGDLTNTFPGDGLDLWVEDVSAATENLLLAAHGLGLGATWCGIYPMKERVTILKEMLKLPKNIIPLNVVPIGYPVKDSTPKNKWRPENIHYEVW